MFSEREAKLVGTSDFVVTRGYVQIRVVGFPSLNVTDLRSAVVADAVVGAGRLSRRSWAACVEFLVGGRGRGGAVRGPCLKRRDTVARGVLGV